MKRKREVVKRRREVVWRGDRGEGTIFHFVEQESGALVSPNLYLFYRAGGKEHTVSALTSDLVEAKKDLKRLTRNASNAREGIEPLRTPKTERVTIADLLDATEARAKADGLASAHTVRYRAKHLRRLLGHLRAVEYKPGHAREYAAIRAEERATKRSEKKVEPSTIHRELEVLSGAFGDAVEEGTLKFRPHVPMPAVDNVSEREFPQERLGELLAALRKRDDAVADLVEFMALTARRPEGVRKLTWSLFDSEAWTLTIPPEKRGNAVLIGLDGTLRAIVERRLSARQLGSDLIFHRRGRKMDPEKDRELFEEACEELELPYGREAGFTPYSVKSTAIGLAHDAGLSESEIMDRSGHKTASMMRRYLKQHPERAHAASVKLEAYLAAGGGRLRKATGGNAESVAVFPSVSVKP